MILRIAGTTSMCSTLILSGLPQLELSLNKTVRQLKLAIDKADSRICKETVYSPWETSKTAEVDLLRGYKVDQFAFITCTLYASGGNDDQEAVMKHLITLGFRKTHPKPVYNTKNGTSVWMLAAPVPRVLKNLKKYDENGFLIVRTKKGGVSPSVASAA